MNWNIDNIVMNTMKHSEMDKLSALNDPYRVDML